MIFGHLLQSARCRAGLSRESLADQCGECTAGELQDYEIGAPVPARVALMLYAVLGDHTGANSTQWSNLAATTRRDAAPTSPGDADLMRRIARTLAGDGNRAVLLRGQLRAIADSGLIDG